MIIKHQNQTPKIHPSSYIAPNAAICGEVTIGENSRIMHGAQVIAEGSPIVIGANCIVLQNAVIRGAFDHGVSIGDNCLIGPNAHVAGCTLEDQVFIATGASIFHGSIIKTKSEVRINGVVHLKTVVPPGSTIPINWVAVGDPMQLFAPDCHQEIWEVQKQYDFPKAVYGIDRPPPGESKMPAVCRVMSERLGSHQEDIILKP